MIALRALLCWTLLTVTSAGLSAASYYATQSGAGSKKGTSLANAWSVAGFNASSAPTGGDTVWFSGAITTQIVPASGGTSTSSVLNLDLTGATLSPSAGISIASVAFVTINGGMVASDAYNAYNVIVRCDPSGASHDITVQNFTYSGATNGTTTFYDNGLCSNVTVQNNTVSYVAHLVNSYRGPVHYITVQNNSATLTSDNTQDDDIIQISDSDHVTIQGNKLISYGVGVASCCHQDMIQTYQGGGSKSQTPYGWVIRYNWIEADSTKGDGNASQMMLEQMGDGSDGTPALKIYGNVFVGDPTDTETNNGVCPCDSSQTPATVYFYNNTVIRHNGPDNTIRFLGPGTLYSRNNVGASDPGISGTWLNWSYSAGATWDYNFFYNFGGCSATYSGPHGSCTVDPVFTNYSGNVYSVHSNSPLINAGDNTIGSEFNQGITPGATWPNPTLVTRTSSAWDIGAFQMAGVQTTVVNPPTQLVVVVQ